MKFKVGDKVRVRKDLKVDDSYNGWDVVEDMVPFKGQSTTVVKLDDEDTYKLDVDEGEYFWAFEMLEPYEEPDDSPDDTYVERDYRPDVSSPDSKTARHANITKQLNEIYEAKNHDYGDAFGQTFRELGIISAVTRITDKTNRLKKLCRSENQVKDESIKDTLMDLANYAIMTLIELEETE